MVAPGKYFPSFSFAGYQATNPTRPLPGVRHDTEYFNISEALNGAIDVLTDIVGGGGGNIITEITDDQHGNRTGGPLHAVATPSSAGFLSAADKVKLDQVSAFCSMVELKALDPAATPVAYLKDPGREGVFLWQAGDFATLVTADTANGLYVKANSVAATVGAWVRVRGSNLIFVEWFGAIGGNPSIDGPALNAAFEMARRLGLFVSDMGGKIFHINSVINIKNGVRGFVGGGSTYKMFTGGRFWLRGIHSGEAANVSQLTIANTIIDANDQINLNVFYAENISYCHIVSNTITGMNSGFAMMLFTYKDGVNPCMNVVVADNTITGAVGNTGTSGSDPTRWFGIHLAGDLDTPAAVVGQDPATYYQATGIAARCSIAPRDIVVVDNIVSGGYYCIYGQSLLNSIIANNRCSNSVRGIAFEFCCSNNLVDGNRIKDCKSAGILNAYGCSGNSLINNLIETAVWVGEALIKSGLGSSRVLIANNKTMTQSPVTTGEYHIYVHCDASFTKIDGNHCTGDCYKAFIGVESAWNPALLDTRHFAYQKSNTNYAFATTTGVEVVNNLIDALTSKAAGAAPDAIYFGAVIDATAGPLALTECLVAGNRVTTDKHAHQLGIIEHQIAAPVAAVTNMVLRGNHFLRAATAAMFDLPRGRQHFSRQEGNSYLDDQVTMTAFASLDTTPSVSGGGGRFFNFVNASATSVTFFDDGVDGQVIRLRGDANTTLVHNSALMRLKGGVNAVLGNANNFITLERSTGIWFETGRSF